MPLLSLPQREHFSFASTLNLNVREGFRAFGDKVLAGVHQSSFQRDLKSWNYRLGRFGAYGTKYGFIRTVPANLRVLSAPEELDGTDPLARLEAGVEGVACELYYADGIPVVCVEFRLYDCSNETFTAQFIPKTSSPTLTASFSFVDGKNYILWARAFDRGPLPPTNPLPQADIVADESNAGEWSALKIRCGSGSFTVAAGKCPSPGCPLYVKAAADAAVSITAMNEATYRAPFDPLARSVSASCLTHTDIRLNSGTFDVNKGSQIIAGLRASRSGPQSALWLLHADLTARLLATTGVFSNGMCECGKSDHHASDVAQAPDGTLYLLNECSLHQYAPDAPAVGERLPGSPVGNGGHPGGQCLRFQNGTSIFSTELLESAPTDLGVFFYDRLVQRPGGKDEIGCGTIWHGPGNTEIYRGALWGFRGTKKNFNETGAKITFDAIRNGVWNGSGVSYDPLSQFWCQLRRRGDLLFWFGFNANGHLDASGPESNPGPLDGTTDTPICAVSDGSKIRLAQFNYLVKRATRCLDGDGGETLLLACNDTATGQGLKNNGRALRVVELPSAGTGSTGGTKVCSFWNSGASEFRVTQSTFTTAGGDVAKVPAYLAWRPQAGSNGGGVWIPTATVPATPYLAASVSGGIIRLHLTGAAPYDFAVWGLLCFQINADGSISGGGTNGGGDSFEPGSTPTNAQEAIDAMPDGTKWRIVQRDVPTRANPLSGFQVTDLAAEKALTAERDTFPTLWARSDSTADLDELTSYTHLCKCGRAQGAGESVVGVDLLVLVSPDAQPCVLPALGRRFG